MYRRLPIGLSSSEEHERDDRHDDRGDAEEEEVRPELPARLGEERANEEDEAHCEPNEYIRNHGLVLLERRIPRQLLLASPFEPDEADEGEDQSEEGRDRLPRIVAWDLCRERRVHAKSGKEGASRRSIRAKTPSVNPLHRSM